MVKAAGILFVVGNKILLLKRSEEGDHPGEWALPGGKLEPMETPEQAARREVFEECGVWVTSLFEMAPGEYTVFRRVLPETFIPVLNDEHTDYLWTTLEDLPTPVHPKLLPLLEYLR